MLRIRPGADPIDALAGALMAPGLTPTQRVAERRRLIELLNEGPAGLVDLLREWRADTPDARLLLVVDQFEELFTNAQAADPDRTRARRILVQLVRPAEREDEAATRQVASLRRIPAQDLDLLPRLATNGLVVTSSGPDDEPLAELGSDEAEPASPSESRATQSATELASCLVPLIRTLPAPYDEALLLTEIEGLPQNQAARQLGLSHSGMKTRVQRGRLKLKQALLQCCEVEVDDRGAVLEYQHRRSSDICR